MNSQRVIEEKKLPLKKLVQSHFNIKEINYESMLRLKTISFTT